MSSIARFFSAPGVPGCLTGVGIFLVLYVFACWKTEPSNTYTFEPRGPGSFEPILARYSRLVEFIVGLATGSIVLLAGSSIFRSAGKLPKGYGFATGAASDERDLRRAVYCFYELQL